MACCCCRLLFSLAGEISWNHPGALHPLWQVLAAYLDYMVELGMLLGGARASTEEQMQQVLDLETELANLTVPQDERRDDEKIYHKLNIAGLQVGPAWIRPWGGAELAGRGLVRSLGLVLALNGVLWQLGTSCVI